VVWVWNFHLIKFYFINFQNVEPHIYLVKFSINKKIVMEIGIWKGKKLYSQIFDLVRNYLPTLKSNSGLVLKVNILYNKNVLYCL